ncbi:C6 finger domain [Mycena kentingensis (nom. inval.)]|nr:C6 finger domain [Mycena kentingensis (nom. inval.)]
MQAPASSSNAPPPPNRAHMACTTCRKAHVKCAPTARNLPCARCTRKGLRCEFLETVEQERRDAMYPPHSGTGYAASSGAYAQAYAAGSNPPAAPPTCISPRMLHTSSGTPGWNAYYMPPDQAQAQAQSQYSYPYAQGTYYAGQQQAGHQTAYCTCPATGPCWCGRR